MGTGRRALGVSTDHARHQQTRDFPLFLMIGSVGRSAGATAAAQVVRELTPKCRENDRIRYREAYRSSARRGVRLCDGRDQARDLADKHRVRRAGRADRHRDQAPRGHARPPRLHRRRRYAPRDSDRFPLDRRRGRCRPPNCSEGLGTARPATRGVERSKSSTDQHPSIFRLWQSRCRTKSSWRSKLPAARPTTAWARISIAPDWARYFDFAADRFPDILRALTSTE